MKKNYGVSEDTENVETDPLLKSFRLLSEIVAEYQQQEEEETNTPEIVEIKEYFKMIAIMIPLSFGLKMTKGIYS